MSREVSIPSQIIMALVDHKEMSTKQMMRYLGGTGTKRGYVSTVLFNLRRKGLIEHTGYSRHQLTETGRREAGRLIGSIKDVHEQCVNEDKQEVVPTQPRKEINWAEEYIKLAMTIAKGGNYASDQRGNTRD